MNPYALLDPAVTALHQLVVPLAAALPLPTLGVRVAVALALVTVAVRVLLLPLSIRALRAQRARAALAPQLAHLRRRHAGDPQRLAAETAALHREAGVPLTGGLLAGLIQLPVLATVYRLVVVPTIGGQPNLVLAAQLFGAPMAAHWPEALATGGALGTGGLALAVLIGALLVLAMVSSRTLAAGPDAPAAVGRALRLLPYATVVVAVVTPVAMGVYLLVSTAWSVAERRLLPRWVA